MHDYKQGRVNCRCHVPFQRSRHREQSQRREDKKNLGWIVAFTMDTQSESILAFGYHTLDLTAIRSGLKKLLAVIWKGLWALHN